MEETTLNVNEFSQEFDILYNNIASNQAPGLTEYEKSVFLTKAQDEIIKNYFTNKPNGNKYQEGIEDSSKRYSDFSCLITVTTVPTSTIKAGSDTIDSRGKIMKLPTDLMLSLNESFIVNFNVIDKSELKVRAISNNRYQVIPVTLAEYQRLMSRPSNDPLKRQVWKLMGNSTSGNGSVEIIPHWRDVSYTLSDGDKLLQYTTNGNNPLAYQLSIRYVRRPYPIILEDLSTQELTINGKNKIYGSTLTSPTEDACELAQELHPEILQRAVELAKVFYTGQPADVINAGQRSE